ncbi:MAG: glucose-1-phosphate cytidylyltransferase [Dysgonamonadaceae bacterium]|jgi:glucose-1-phosphate cytidylyltransferase|nr:glucose-1-phosphate cytidylyltransferase [Dysgonamonadaceae bacterium]
MKVVIFAGGMGTRLSEETSSVPKPMVRIGGRPILWHIMKLYSRCGFNDFVVLGGYRCEIIKEYFFNYFIQNSDVTFNLQDNSFRILSRHTEPWQVTVLDTGLATQTGGRLKRAEEFIGNERFMLTYGDGLSDVNLNALLDFHLSHKRLATMTSVQPEGRFGSLTINSESDQITSFVEKPKGDGTWINGGFFVCEPGVFRYLNQGDETVWERRPLESLATDNELFAYKHTGFWKPMDTLRDKNQLEELWKSGSAPWKTW